MQSSYAGIGESVPEVHFYSGFAHHVAAVDKLVSSNALYLYNTA